MGGRGEKGDQLRGREGESHGLHETLPLYIVGYSFSVMYMQYYKTNFFFNIKVSHQNLRE